ncbi:chromosome-associated kinesin KIF4-like [Rhodnius prolixus]|uniref:chromosome-associated kinesin KIF4-like n=1 Tax=Rhodnius prolixus TaxID=13249 RepID=UPI003D18DB9D
MDSVKVALRIRPMVKSEIDNGCQSCIERIPNEPQVGIGKANQMYTFNYVFDEYEGQSKVYNTAVKNLIENLFKGYNVTILAYGQTGSGKTYTMGTNYSGTGEMGVIPRAVYDIFEIIKTSVQNTFKVTVSFVELYNESLYDLLTNKPREQSIVDMREHNNALVIPGLTELDVTTPEETLNKLKEGSVGRVVGATAMNAQSSRSHAIFTINIRITPKEKPTETIMSKFHLVDLAGSERSKKTGATGDRFREGVNINKGLLVLGNVISQLGEGNNSFINYRDSKLTRLLQDSLGGNSFTLMIACVSPADYNQEESISTLRYADRAKKIKNKPVINQDPHVAEISRLRKENEELRLKMIEGGDFTFQCPPNHKELEQTVITKEIRIKELEMNLVEALSENSRNHERQMIEDKARGAVKDKLSHLLELCEKNEDSEVLNEIKTVAFEVKAEHIRSEQELLALQKQYEILPKSGDKDEIGEEDDGTEDEMPSPIKKEHLASQAQLNDQILKLTKSLAAKEDLMSRMCESSDHLNNMKNTSQENLEDLKRQIAELQKEKEDLVNQLKQTSSDKTNSSKVAEQRRKRLQELEQKVAALTKKIVEQERIIKLKESSDVKIMNLKSEILSMKQMKVRLVQQMKAENEKFREWKVQKDKELHKLRNQNVKNQNQLKKMERVHSLQQNVLRRKLEAAAATNKRIMAVLERQKNGRSKKVKKTVMEQIKDRVHEELELIESYYQAEKSLDHLIQDRAVLTKELVNVKEELKDATLSNKIKNNLSIDGKKLEHELALRSAEISDLQQKLSDIEDELKKNNWEMLETHADAKQALIYVFNVLTEKTKENLNKSFIIMENEALKNEQNHEIEMYKRKLDDLMEYYKCKLEDVEKEAEDRVVELLKHINAKQLEQNPDCESNQIFTNQMVIIEQLKEKICRLEEEKLELQNATFNPKVSSYEEAYLRFIDDQNSIVNSHFEENKFPRKSRLTGNFQQLNFKEDCKENCMCNLSLLNKTYTKEDLDQIDIDSLNELAPKRMRTETKAETRHILRQLNKTFNNPNLS